MNHQQRKKTKAGGGRTRGDHSLGELTRRFITIIKASQPLLSFDLNEAVEVLGVPKRRIYDITNVLEGIGLIEKTTKNKIQWRNGDIADLQVFNADITRLNEACARGIGPSTDMLHNITGIKNEDENGVEYPKVAHKKTDEEYQAVFNFVSESGQTGQRGRFAKDSVEDPLL